MAYLVTTSRLHPGDAVTPDHLELLDQPRTVATLEEAREAIRRTVPLGEWSGVVVAQMNALSEPGESGGTIGPLPDGTVIEVRPA